MTEEQLRDLAKRLNDGMGDALEGAGANRNEALALMVRIAASHLIDWANEDTPPHEDVSRSSQQQSVEEQLVRLMLGVYNAIKSANAVPWN